MKERTIKLLDGAEITLANLLSLYDNEKQTFNISSDEVIDTVKLARDLLVMSLDSAS